MADQEITSEEPFAGEMSVLVASDTVLETEELVQQKEILSDEIYRKNKIYLLLISVMRTTRQQFTFSFLNLFAYLLGASASFVGLMTSTNNLLSNVFQWIWGYLTDDNGRKKIFVFGLLLTLSGTLLLIFSVNYYMVFASVILIAFSNSMTLAAWQGILGDVTTKETRSRIIGQLSYIGTFFSTVALLVAGQVIDLLPFDQELEFRVMFAIAAAVSFIALVLALFMNETNVVSSKTLDDKESLSEMRESRIKQMLVSSKRKIIEMKTYLLDDKVFLKYFTFYVMFFFTMSMAWPIFPYVQINIVKVTTMQVTFIWASFALFNTLGQYFASKVGDKIGRKPLLVGGVMSMFLVTTLYAIARSWVELAIAGIIGGFGMGLLIVGSSSYVLDLAPDNRKATYASIVGTGMGIVAFTGSLLGGAFLDLMIRLLGNIYSAVFVVLITIAAMRFTAAILFLTIPETLRKNQQVE